MIPRISLPPDFLASVFPNKDLATFKVGSSKNFIAKIFAMDNGILTRDKADTVFALILDRPAAVSEVACLFSRLRRRRLSEKAAKSVQRPY